MTERFNVVIFDPEGYWHYGLRDATAEGAVRVARFWVDRADREDIARIMITDEDDFTAFLWERGKGIVYPTSEERTKA